MHARQRGASALFVAVLLLGVAAIVFAALALLRQTATSSEPARTLDHLVAAKQALVQFAVTTGRLPCPANPASDTGIADPDTASAVCNSPAGTLPWQTLGMRSDDALDAWSRKISYRVSTANGGSLTQAEGASMVKCDPSPAFPDTLTPISGSSGGLCKDNYNSDAALFLSSNKGLAVNDQGTAVPDAAYVLISHGATGLGAYVPGGGRKLPLPSGADELANTGSTGPFVVRTAVTTGIGPEDSAYFDDIVVYERLESLIRHANLYARTWRNFSSATFNAATMQSVIGSSAYGDTGQQSIVVNNARVTAFDSGGNQDISFNVNTPGGAEGIGGVSGSGDGLAQTGGEGVKIELSKKAGRFGVTLNDFGTIPAFFTFVWKEQAQFRFIDSTSGTFVNITKQGCNSDGGLASFASLDPGAALGDPTFQFDTVEIRPQLSTAVPFFGSISSSFFISAFVTCDTGAACNSPLEAPANVCP